MSYGAAVLAEPPFGDLACSDECTGSLSSSMARQGAFVERAVKGRMWRIMAH